MSYPRDLDDYAMAELAGEIVRRFKELERKHCPYCKLPLDSHTCRMSRSAAEQQAYVRLVPAAVTRLAAAVKLLGEPWS